MAQATGPGDQLEQARERLDDDQDHIRQFSRAIDPRTAAEGDKKSLSTVSTYTNALRLLEERMDDSLPSQSTASLTEAFDAISDDLAASTVGQYQSAAKAFYTWSDDHDVDPGGFSIITNSGSAIDPQSVLTGAEFHAIRQAADNPRDRAIIDLFGYTGQRYTAIQTLRVKDVRPNEGPTGRYSLNTTVDGLKGAETAMTNRPLLGAKRSVLDWLEYHPTGEPDDALITTMPSTSRGNPGEPVSHSTLTRTLNGAAERAGVTDKPTNPHAFRHYFATVAKTEYGMDDETVRRLLGHGPSSRVMETTYRHLSDDDVIADAETSFDDENAPEEETGRAVPPTCRVCSEPLEPHYKRCPRCDEPYLDTERLSDGDVERIAERMLEMQG